MDQKILLTFENDKVNLHGCNFHNADITIDKTSGSYTLGVIASTKMYCQIDVDSFVLKALQKGKKIEFRYSYVMILDDNDNVVLSGNVYKQINEGDKVLNYTATRPEPSRRFDFDEVEEAETKPEEN